ncbi:MAG: response regulator [Pseudomonadota bacterium]
MKPEKIEKILVVDDETAISDILLKGLQMVGYSQVEMASNGLEGYEKYKTFLPDLVFMDMEMPVMNGYESSSKIKSFDPEAKILVVTGNPGGSLAQRTLHEGIALTLLEKPLKLANLKQIISENMAS